MKYDILFPESASAVEIIMDKDETLCAESDAMICMSPSVKLEGKVSGSILGALFRNMFSNESFFIQKFTATKNGSKVMIGHDALGGIESVELDGDIGLIVQKGGFLAYTGNIEISTKNQGVLAGIFSGEGMLLLHLTGNGTVFVSSFGAIKTYILEQEEEIIVDNGHLVAWSDNMRYSIESASSSLIDAFTSGECAVCRFKGPGVLMVQTRNEEMFKKYVNRNIRVNKGR